MLFQVSPVSVESCHCSVGAGLPEQATVNAAVLGDVTDTLVGCVVTWGVVLTVRVAALLVVEPAVLAQMDRYWLAFCGSDVGVRVSVGEVPPVMVFQVAPP